MSFPGWQDLDTVITSLPQKWLLPKVASASWNDPKNLRGFGSPIPAVTPTLGASTCVVREIGVDVEATFRRPEIFGTVLLDAFVADDAEPCSLLLEVYDDDRETVLWEVSTARAHATPYLVEPDNYGEQEVDVAAGGATIGTVTVMVIDPALVPGDQDSGYLTDKLGLLGKGNIAGRRCVLKRFISEDLGYTVIADGPASAPTLDPSYAAYAWQIRDTRETERKLRLFDGGGGIDGEAGELPVGATTLLPQAVTGGYGFDPDTTTYLVDPSVVLLGQAQLGAIPEIGFDDMRSVDLVSGPGNLLALRTITTAAAKVFDGVSITFGPKISLGGDDWERIYHVKFANLRIYWRAQGSSDPWNILAPDALQIHGRETDIGGVNSGRYESLILSSPDPDIPNETGRQVQVLLLGDARGSAFLPADNQDIELMVIYRGPPSKDLPVYVEGLTAGEFARNAYAGVYSPRDGAGAVVASGIRYDEPTLLLLTEPVRMRLTEVIDDARDWLEKHLYAALGYAPALDRLGQISPVSQVPPTDGGGLPEITNAITEPSPDWSAGERIINVVRFQYARDYRPGNPENAETGDGLAAREVDIEYRDEGSVARFGEQVLEITTEAFRAIGTSDSKPVAAGLTEETGYVLAEARQRHLLNRFAFGAQAISVAVMRSAIPTMRAGDWVVLELSWLPDYVTHRRGLLGMGQVVSIADLDCAWRKLLVEQVTPEDHS